MSTLVILSSGSCVRIRQSTLACITTITLYSTKHWWEKRLADLMAKVLFTNICDCIQALAIKSLHANKTKNNLMKIVLGEYSSKEKYSHRTSLKHSNRAYTCRSSVLSISAVPPKVFWALICISNFYNQIFVLYVHTLHTYVHAIMKYVKEFYAYTQPVIEYLACKLHTCIQEHCRCVLIQFLSEI